MVKVQSVGFSDVLLKGATSRFVHPEKFSLNFSSLSFAVRVNLRRPAPSLFLLGLLSPLVLFYLTKLLFCGFLQLEGNFAWCEK